MALSKNINLNNGITVDNAYIKIENIGGSKDNCSLCVSIAVSKNLADSNNYVSKKYYNFKPNISDDAKNFIKQGYEYLKTLTEYAGAVDILDEGQAA